MHDPRGGSIWSREAAGQTFKTVIVTALLGSAVAAGVSATASAQSPERYYAPIC